MWTKINCIISSTTDVLVPLRSIPQYQVVFCFFFFTIFKSQKAKNSSSTLPQISSLFYSYLSRQHTQPLNYSKQNLGVIVDTLFFPQSIRKLPKTSPLFLGLFTLLTTLLTTLITSQLPYLHLCPGFPTKNSDLS